MVLIQVDDFLIVGTDKFLERILTGISETLTLSKIERDKFRFTELNIEKYGDQIKVTMDDYA